MKKMNKIIPIILISCFTCVHHTSLLSQTVTQEFVVSFANSDDPKKELSKIKELTQTPGYQVRITTKDSLKCIPYTYLWEVTGSSNAVIAIADYIKRHPAGTNPARPVPNPSGNPGTWGRQMNLPPLRCISQDSLDAYSSCYNQRRNTADILMAVIDDGIGKEFGSNRSRVNYATFFQPYLWINPTNGTPGYSFLSSITTSPIAENSKHGSAVTYRIVDMLRKANVQNVKIMVLQTHNPVTGLGRIWDVCRALDFAYCRKVNIINISLSGLESEGTSVLELIIKYMGTTQNTLVVAASGNDGKDVSIPLPDRQHYCTASYQLPNLMEVAANARCSDALMDFSNRGIKNIHLSAPGDNVYCAVPVAVDASGIMALSGTSLAAPHVSSAAAILGVNRPAGTSFNYLPIVKSILATVTNTEQLRGLVSSGGRLNTCNALTFFLRNYPTIRMVAPISNTTVAANNKSIFNTLDISPNPVNSDFTIHFNSEQVTQTELVLRDILGRVILNKNWCIYTGDNTLLVDASKLNRGIYFINMRIGEQNIVQKIVKN
jgi:hypothetical protein